MHFPVVLPRVLKFIRSLKLCEPRCTCAVFLLTRDGYKLLCLLHFSSCYLEGDTLHLTWDSDPDTAATTCAWMCTAVLSYSDWDLMVCY